MQRLLIIYSSWRKLSPVLPATHLNLVINIDNIDIDVDNLVDSIDPIGAPFDPRTPNSVEVLTSIVCNPDRSPRDRSIKKI
jgi:hypothetical protein